MLKKLNFWLIGAIVILVIAVFAIEFLTSLSHQRLIQGICCIVGVIPACVLLYRQAARGGEILFAALPYFLFLSFLFGNLIKWLGWCEEARFVFLVPAVLITLLILIRIRRRYREKIIRQMFNLEN